MTFSVAILAIKVNSTIWDALHRLVKVFSDSAGGTSLKIYLTVHESKQPPISFSPQKRVNYLGKCTSEMRSSAMYTFQSVYAIHSFHKIHAISSLH